MSANAVAGVTAYREDAPVRLRVEHLAKSYETRGGPVPVIADLTFDVRAGEIACIVGPSGIGKTTLLKCLAGLQPASSGSASIDGQVIDGPPRDMALVFQEYTRSLMPWLTVVKNVGMPLAHLRLPTAERSERIRGALLAVGLDGAEQKYPWQLSGGMQQRASICRALIHEPQMLLLDEPFGALDAFTREELWCILRDLQAEQKFNVILVTHDLRESVFLADTVYVMSKSPGRFVVRRDIDLPRPRDLEVTYTPEFSDIVYELRGHIGALRKSGTDTAAAIPQ